MTAIMGSSGAGKTTMMNILAQRNLGGLQIGGTLRANGQPYDYKIGNISSYVQQDDIFVGSLTVKGSGHIGILVRVISGFRLFSDQTVDP